MNRHYCPRSCVLVNRWRGRGVILSLKSIRYVRLALGKFGARNAGTGSAAIGGRLYRTQLSGWMASAKACSGLRCTGLANGWNEFPGDFLLMSRYQLRGRQASGRSFQNRSQGVDRELGSMTRGRREATDAGDNTLLFNRAHLLHGLPFGQLGNG